ncbi:MAG: protein translocase subunit SecF [Proteobacteria bacterium]|nr:MAG: protein translocase subunit SecF [Pseudomonadota bacterium]
MTEAALATTNYDFLGKRYICLTLSVIMLLGFVYIWQKRGMEKFGIDFLGGHEIVANIEAESNSEAIAKALEARGLQSPTVQAFEVGSQDVSIRVALDENLDSKAILELVKQALEELYPGKISIDKTDSVGATIGAEVKRKALWAISLGLLMILIYVAVRFEFSYALGAVVALFHDVGIATGVYLWAGHDLNGSALAAALTIIGYSVNDTIVTFDRVREQLRKRKEIDLYQTMNESVNFCLSRTIITGGLTLVSALGLLLLGGGAIQDLAVFLVAGIITGIYSTIYIAAPVALWWEKMRGRYKPKQ